MKTIRIGNDINVTWKVLSRNGMPYSLEEKILGLWLVSGPFRKEISTYQVRNINKIEFSIDAEELKRYGVYKLIFRAKDGEAVADDAAYELVQVFQIVSASYPWISDVAIDGSVDLEFTSILNNVIVSTLRGESAYEILVRHGYEGTEDDWAEMMSNLVDDADVIDERLDALELAGASISFTASPSVISSGMSTNVTLAVSVSGLGDAGADKIEILDSGSQVIAESSGTSLSKQVTLSVGASYTVRVTHGSASISKSLSVVAVGHIYYGSGTDASDFESNKVVYTSPTTSVARTYSVVVRNQGDYVFFRIPSTMTINKATLNGFGFPMSLIETADGYKLYRSDNTYNAGTIQLVIS